MSSDLVSELLIFQKWHDSSKLIKLRSDTPSVVVELWVTVTSVSPTKIVLTAAGDAGKVVLDVSRALIKYEEPREAEEEDVEWLSSRFECALNILLDGSTPILLYEVKDDESE